MSVETTKRGPASFLEGEARRALERDALPAFLPRQRWFAGKARPLASVRFLDASEPGELAGSSRLTLVEVTYATGHPDVYLLPLGLATGPVADRIGREEPGRVVARIDKLGLVHDALAEPVVCAALLDAIAGSRSIPAGSGTIRGEPTSAFAAARGPVDRPLAVTRGAFEQSNSAVIFGDRLILKVFRRLDPGINPDFEIGRFLSDKTAFDRVPKTTGALLYERPGSEPLMLGILQGLVPNQGSGWDHALGELAAYYRRAGSTAPISKPGRRSAAGPRNSTWPSPATRPNPPSPPSRSLPTTWDGWPARSASRSRGR